MQRKGKDKNFETGFTLVEILCVLVVLGLMSSVVILSLPKPKSGLDRQAAQLTTQINALAQDGLIKGQVVAAGFSKTGYRLYNYDGGVWDVRHSGIWGGDYRLAFKRGDVKVKLSKEDIVPSLVFQPTGQSTPFELSLSDRSTQYVLMTTGDGRVEMKKTLR